MSVNDEAEHPWLVEEKALIRTAVERGVPFWGSCLGVQLLAAALGARVYAGPAPEVGVLPVELTPEAADDPVFAGLPSSARRRCSGTATRSTCPTARCCSRRRRPTGTRPSASARSAYGVQFHIEVTPSMGEEWATIPEYAAYADRVLGPGGSDEVLADFRAATDEMQGHARGMFERWLALVPARAGHSSAST